MTYGFFHRYYTFSERGIVWPGEAKKYTDKPDYNLDEIVPPPNWRDRYPNNYTEAKPFDQHFQKRMRTACLPTFTKLWGRNNDDKLLKGNY